METTDTAAVLILHLPPAALGGIDLLSFTTTPRFRGIKNLQPGFHFVYAGSSTSFSERHGIWFEVPSNPKAGSPSLIVTKWDAATETLIRESDEAEVLRWRGNLGSIWREGLTPYRQVTTDSTNAEEDRDDWPVLTSIIGPSLLVRIVESESDAWKLSSASSSKEDLEAIPGVTTDDLNAEADNELHFLPIDLKQTWREGATGRERTNAAQDRSWALEQLIDTCCSSKDSSEIIGEMQLCFLMVLTINNYSCLEQWKRILTLLFTCKRAVASKPDFFVSAIAALRLQLQHCKDAEGGLIDLADEGGSLLKSLLTRFRKGLDGLPGIGTQDVVDELDDLEDYLRQDHGWQFGGTFAKSGVLELEDGEQVRMDTTAFDEDDETGEFAPQIVELTSEQAKLLGSADAGDLHVSLSRTSLKEAQARDVLSEVYESEESEESDESDETESNHSEESEEAGELDDLDARY